jgi:hypothetical protein
VAVARLDAYDDVRALIEVLAREGANPKVVTE